MYKRITKRELKSLLLVKEHPIELSLCDKKRDCNHILSAMMEVDISEYSELDDILNDKWVKFSGDTKEPQLCIWIDEE